MTSNSGIFRACAIICAAYGTTAHAAVSFVNASAAESLSVTSTFYYFNGDDLETYQNTTTTSSSSSSNQFAPVTTAGASSVTLSSPSSGALKTLGSLQGLTYEPVTVGSGDATGVRTDAASYTFSLDTTSYYKFTGQEDDAALSHGGFDQTVPVYGSITALGSGKVLSEFNGQTAIGTGATGYGTYLLSAGTYKIALNTSVTADYDFGNQQYKQLYFSITAVPEPITWAMIIGGLGVVGATMRLARKSDERFTRNVRKLAQA